MGVFIFKSQPFLIVSWLFLQCFCFSVYLFTTLNLSFKFLILLKWSRIIWNSNFKFIISLLSTTKVIIYKWAYFNDDDENNFSKSQNRFRFCRFIWLYLFCMNDYDRNMWMFSCILYIMNVYYLYFMDM